MIKAENISKEYFLGAYEPYYSLRDQIAGIFKPSTKKESRKKFWALKDINFEIKAGEAIGIIGRNGAGKSTLLKILSQITPPTTGKITMNGRVASLLEVGTGFHPELTGRENIFLNGAILGMNRQEIAKKFDEIVDFAEITEFLDTPVKRYSSGMYVRLAFAVAAHLEPEILLVDEVLAVGDLAFRNKCLGKMDDVAKKDGRTVLFVSHNMASIRNLCQKCIYLDKGKIVDFGDINVTMNKYLNNISLDQQHLTLDDRPDRKGTGKVLFTDVKIERDQKPAQVFVSGEDASFVVYYKSKDDKPLSNVDISVSIDNQMSDRVFSLSTILTGETYDNIPPSGSLKVDVPCLPLVAGRYAATLFMTVKGEITDWIQQAFFFTVETGDFYKSGKVLEGQGDILVKHNFN